MYMQGFTFLQKGNLFSELKQNVSLELTDIWGDLLFIHLHFLDETANASSVSCNH